MAPARIKPQPSCSAHGQLVPANPSVATQVPISQAVRMSAPCTATCPTTAFGTAGTGRQGCFWCSRTFPLCCGVQLGQPLGFLVALVRWWQWHVCWKGLGPWLLRGRHQGFSVSKQVLPASAHVSLQGVQGFAEELRAEPGVIGLHELPLLWHPATENQTSLEVGQNCVTNNRSHVDHPVPPSQNKGRGFLFQEGYLPAPCGRGIWEAEGPEPCFNPVLPGASSALT